MKTFVSLALRSLALSSVAAFAGAQASCTQPPTACTVSAALPYAAKYTQTDAGAAPCGERAGDILGMGSYNPPAAGGTAPDLTQVSMAIRTHTLGGLVAYAADRGVVDEAEGHAPHAFGPFAAGLPENDICTPTLEPAVQALAAIEEDLGDPADPDDDLPAQDAVDVTERWENVSVFVTAAALGTQVKATYTIEDRVAGCTASYDVVALFPAVFCEGVDADGNPSGLPDENLCSAVALPDQGYAVGSGISPDFPVVCDPALLMCVLNPAGDPDGEFPFLQ